MKKDEKNVNDPIDSVSYGETVIPKNRLEYLVQKCKETLKKSPGIFWKWGCIKAEHL